MHKLYISGTLYSCLINILLSLYFPRINFIDDKQVVSNSETLKLVQELDSNKDSSLEIQGLYFQKSFRRMINI